ncbi:hypothetical protein DFH09DRAFT_1083035 [Mycena vulgaris]|nr:hypothetical protein DFH09DRAFT_1098965 [Mycena vulgaris]KAJ6561039.1 hypothetical protein DFH09DRAFT_1083035 [Mycena vulgaris]
MAAPRGLRNAVVMIQSSGPSFRQFAEINRGLVPTLVSSRFWPLLIAQNAEECVLTTLMELRTSEWRDLLAWACSYQIKEASYRAIRALNLYAAEKPSLWLDIMHQEAAAAMPWLCDFEAEWPLTVAWRRIDGTYPATLIRLK